MSSFVKISAGRYEWCFLTNLFTSAVWVVLFFPLKRQWENVVLSTLHGSSREKRYPRFLKLLPHFCFWFLKWCNRLMKIIHPVHAQKRRSALAAKLLFCWNSLLSPLGEVNKCFNVLHVGWWKRKNFSHNSKLSIKFVILFSMLFRKVVFESRRSPYNRGAALKHC